MKVAVPLAKDILAPLGITAAASAIDAGIQKKMHGSGTTTLIISNEEMNDIKFVQALEDSNILFKGVIKQSKTKQNNKAEFLSMLLGTLGVILLGNLLVGKGILRTGSGRVIERAGDAKEWYFWCCLIL